MIALARARACVWIISSVVYFQVRVAVACINYVDTVSVRTTSSIYALLICTKACISVLNGFFSKCLSVVLVSEIYVLDISVRRGKVM